MDDKCERRAIKLKFVEINIQRQRVIQEAVRVFDLNHSLELAALRGECGALGHVSRSVEDNGFGYQWKRCAICGSRFDIESYG